MWEPESCSLVGVIDDIFPARSSLIQNPAELSKHVHFRLSSDDPICVKRPSSIWLWIYLCISIQPIRPITLPSCSTNVKWDRAKTWWYLLLARCTLRQTLIWSCHSILRGRMTMNHLCLMMVKAPKCMKEWTCINGCLTVGTQGSSFECVLCHSTHDCRGTQVTHTGKHYMKCLDVSIRKYCRRVHHQDI